MLFEETDMIFVEEESVAKGNGYLHIYIDSS